MTRRRRWLLAVLAVVLVLGAATPIALVLRPCVTHYVVLLNASRWAAQVTLQILTSETGPRDTVWSGIVETYAPPLRIPIGAARPEGGVFGDCAFSRDGSNVHKGSLRLHCGGYQGCPFLSNSRRGRHVHVLVRPAPHRRAGGPVK